VIVMLLCAPVSADDFYDSFFADEDEQPQHTPLVNKSFVETDVRQVLRDISAQTGVRSCPMNQCRAWFPWN
jgi:hypothetical protein